MLSVRARQYLASRDREAPLPTAQVEAIIARRGVSAPPAWLAFHDEFAGYSDQVGADVARWGLSFEHGAWCLPCDVTIRYQDGQPRSIVCADVHPSHGYELNLNGEFVGPLYVSSSFSIKVERDALEREFGQAGPIRRELAVSSYGPEQREALLASLRAHYVPEASDEYAHFYCSPDKLLCHLLRTDGLRMMVRVERD